MTTLKDLKDQLDSMTSESPTAAVVATCEYCQQPIYEDSTHTMVSVSRPSRYTLEYHAECYHIYLEALRFRSKKQSV